MIQIVLFGAHGIYIFVIGQGLGERVFFIKTFNERSLIIGKPVECCQLAADIGRFLFGCKS